VRAIPLKPEYGPTLGRALAPRWRAASTPLRVLAVAAGASLVALVVAAALTLQDAQLSHGGPVPFNFRYRGLYRAAPDPGGYARVAAPRNGPLGNSFAVEPLRLPPYSGSLTGELPLFASDHIRALAARVSGFDLQGEGKTRVNTVPAYSINYSARLGGRLVYGREILLLPDVPGVRDGVDIVMLSRPSASITSSALVGTVGVLQLPLRSFAFG
jgi:hypothetical protein